MLLALPFDVLRLIFNTYLLDYEHLCIMRLVCKRFSKETRKDCPLLDWHSRNIVAVDVARRGHLSVLKWLRSIFKCDLDSDVFAHAAESGNLELLQWLKYEVNCPWTRSAFTSALETKNIELLEWLKKNNAPYAEACSSSAAIYGRLENLKWLKANGYSIAGTYCAWLSSENGHLEVLQWLVETLKCPVDDDVFHGAVLEGQIEVAKWCHSKDSTWKALYASYSPFKTATLESVAAKGDLEMLKWLVEISPEFAPHIPGLIRAAAAHPATAAWIHTHTFPKSD
jgi:hypothetical protein